ncbi:hypothetical protein N7495_005171 [Penicillium taxi]|uniref:uncharacterized protein n=1 Tax=Penicillium taxi TaxID=168475 RepID=UPI00254549C7|nr:uncharacterized protein N7495_005171 [Penicillium taxi]KAJ5893480.1 hypothetical protein N7495_005171 [Penicillium taxi]
MGVRPMTLRQKANFANEKCLRGLFGWALDLGGLGSLEDPNNISLSNTSLSGANIDGGSDGTSDFYVGQEIFSNSTIVGIAPMNMILPPSTLGSISTFYLGLFTTSIKFAWETIGTATIDDVVITITTITRTVMNTTIIGKSYGGTGISPHKTKLTLNRSLILPPWPWSTTYLSTDFLVGPTIYFTQGDPASPIYTARYGTKYTIFCDTPCEDDYTDSLVSSGFNDPSDLDLPSHEKYAGPDYKNDSYNGLLYVSFRCIGSDYDSTSGECLGSDCEQTGCIGDGCIGCSGSDYNGSGICFGLDYISLGYIGLGCIRSTRKCSSYGCHKVSCSGPNCNDGIYKGDGCETEDIDYESEEADIYTEFISS